MTVQVSVGGKHSSTAVISGNLQAELAWSASGWIAPSPGLQIPQRMR